MGTLFISHSSRDNDPARRVRDWLREEGWRDTFLDLDPEHGLAPGQRWQEELKKAGERCSAVIVLVSPEWVASRWCVTEFLVASQLGKRIFPVLIAPTPFADVPVELTAHFQMADISRPEIEADGLGRLRIGLRRAGLDPGDFPWPPADEPGRPPYRGLHTLEEADAAIFFGRDFEITKGLDALRRMRAGQPERMLVILGASGSGKSSFLRAGLLARLRRDEENFLVLPIVRPGRAALSDPTGLAHAFGLSDNLTQKAIADRFATLRAPVVDRLARYAQAGQQDPAVRPPTLILPIDQGEELFAAEQSEGAAACTALLEAIAADKDLLVIVTLRSDSFAALQDETSLSAIPRLPFDLPALPLAAFREVIEGPGRLARPPIRFEETLTAQLVSDLDQADALPLLAFTLERLVVDYGADGVIELAEYRDDLGGLDGAIGRAAAAVLGAAREDRRLPADPVELERLARAAFIPWMLRLEGADQAPKRRVALLRELPAEAWPLVEHMVDQRLLISDRRDDGETTVEVSHEAVLRHWGQLGRWIGEEREALVQVETVLRAAADWHRATPEQQDSLLLHRAERLAFAENLLARQDFAELIGSDGRAYLAACRRAETDRLAREREEQERRVRDAERIAEEQRKVAGEQQKVARRTRIGALVAFALMAVAVAAALVAWQQRNAFEAQRTAALERETVALAALSSVASQHGQYRDALKLAIAAWPRTNDPNRPMLRRTFAAFNAALPRVRERLRLRHAKAVNSVAVSPDNTRIVTASDDNTARLWDAMTGAPIGEAMEHEDAVNAAAFSPNGTRVVTASSDKTARLWSSATGAPLGQPMEHADRIWSAAFSPDGARLVTASDDNTARLWDAMTGEQVGQPMKHEGDVWTAEFSLDGTRIVTASADRTARLWDAANGVPLGRPIMHEDPVWSAALSPDGRRILTASWDKITRIWDAATGEPIGQAMKHEGPVKSAAFSPDGTYIVTTSDDNTARLWDAATGAPIGEAMRHEDPVWSAAFSPGGGRIVTASEDHTVRVWDAATGAPIGEVMRHEDPAWSAAFSPDGTRIVTASADHTARVWDVASGGPIGEAMRHLDPINSAAFSLDGTHIVTASKDNTARLWDAATGAPIGQPMKHEDSVSSAIFSPDGTRIVTVSADNRVQLWDAATGNPIGEAMEHRDLVSFATFSPDGKRIVTASIDSTVRLCDATTSKEIVRFEAPGSTALSVVFTPKGAHIVTASDDNTARLSDAATGAPIGAPMKHEYLVRSAAFSPDGTHIVTTSDDNTARIWDAATGAPIGAVMEHGNFIGTAAFSPDGRRIVTASTDKTARLWDAATGAPIGEPLKHENWVTSAAFSRDGARIVTVSRDNMARLWDVATGAVIGDAMAHDGLANPTILSPDGEFVVTTFGSAARVFHAPDSRNRYGFATGCGVLAPQTDLAEIEKSYGLDELKPICRDNSPAPFDPAQLK